MLFLSTASVMALILCTTASVSVSMAGTKSDDRTPPKIYGVVAQHYVKEHDFDPLDEICVYDETDVKCEIVGEIGPEYGDYEVIYRATDEAGNIAQRKGTVSVIQSANTVSEEDLNNIVWQILDSIITDGMTDYEKCLAVYNYLHGIAYTGVLYDEDCIDAAYNMLAYRTGDCFAYFSAAKALLKALGYRVLKVENNNGFTHTWSLVSTDNGKTWYHFDPTCWRWSNGEDLCMITDAELTEYGYAHLTGGVVPSHGWDTNNYPATPDVKMLYNQE